MSTGTCMHTMIIKRKPSKNITDASYCQCCWWLAISCLRGKAIGYWLKYLLTFIVRGETLFWRRCMTILRGHDTALNYYFQIWYCCKKFVRSQFIPYHIWLTVTTVFSSQVLTSQKFRIMHFFVRHLIQRKWISSKVQTKNIWCGEL